MQNGDPLPINEIQTLADIVLEWRKQVDLLLNQGKVREFTPVAFALIYRAPEIIIGGISPEKSQGLDLICNALEANRQNSKAAEHLCATMEAFDTTVGTKPRTFWGRVRKLMTRRHADKLLLSINPEKHHAPAIDAGLRHAAKAIEAVTDYAVFKMRREGQPVPEFLMQKPFIATEEGVVKLLQNERTALGIA